MDRREMLDIARRELAHIPDWPFHQRLLRMAYWNNRLHSLSRKATYPDDPLVIVKQSIKDVASSAPGEKFEYDKMFFAEESRKRRGR